MIAPRLALAFALALAGSGAAAATLPPEIDAAIAEAARSPVPAAISAAVIASIEARPDLVEPIVLRAARAAPAYSARIAADAAHAYPAFAPRIAAAASTATPEQAAIIVQVTSEPRVAASRSAVKSAVEASPAVQELDRSNWTVRLALGAAGQPEYDGAEDYEFQAFPLVDIDWRRRFFVRANGGLNALTSGLGPTGIGWNFIISPNWQIGTRLTLDFGRDNDLDPRLTGTRSIDNEVELGLFAEFYSGPWNLGGDVRQGVGLGDNSHNGFLFELHTGYAVRLSRRERVFTGISATYAGPSYMGTYYDKGTFRADSGVRDAGAYLVLEGDLSQHLFARFEARAKRLLFDAAKSPAIDPDSKNQFMGILQLGYAF